MRVYIVMSNLTGNVMAVYSTYGKASDWLKATQSTSQFTIREYELL